MTTTTQRQATGDSIRAEHDGGGQADAVRGGNLMNLLGGQKHLRRLRRRTKYQTLLEKIR